MTIAHRKATDWSLAKWAPTAGFVVLTQAAGAVGALFTDTGNWYAQLDKAPFNPPNWAFGPVWVLLYALIGIAAGRVWARGGVARARALVPWFVQLGLNAFWTPVFFGAKRPGVALVILGLLLPAIAFTAVRFRQIDRVAAWMMAPYLAWSGFATLLNAWIVVAN